jgi:hypothetical protein
MALKFRVKSREEVPAEHQSLYVERDGGFVLDVDGAVEKARLDEVRNSNTALKREVETLNGRLADNSVESMVLQVASRFGVRASALLDLTNRARQVFSRRRFGCSALLARCRGRSTRLALGLPCALLSEDYGKS